MLKDIQFDIITQSDSYIQKGAYKYEVIHEIGHILVDKLRINNDSRFINIINNTLDKFNYIRPRNIYKRNIYLYDYIKELVNNEKKI
ncbi:MAG: hypothetical protein HFJ36_06465 [Clostridia bacterium]|nr:hypothetical protein [Clostridia bacterium]